ncbi:MAG: YicC/YloC family endoribonuclease [Bacteroidota bacterium]
MIRSMTGFGSAVFSDGEKSITVEIRSLNSKFLDLSVRLPKSYSEFEPEWRNLITDRLERGKVSLTIEWQATGKSEILQAYRPELFLAHYSELKKLAELAGTKADDRLFELAVRAQEANQSSGKESVSSEEKELVTGLIRQALSECDRFRAAEGSVLEGKLAEYLSKISAGLEQVAELDPARIERLRNRLKGSVTAFFGSEGYDLNRLEQEMIYYIEKLDIHEERVRLRTHLDHFLNAMSEQSSGGRKLNFISQEIGREINTIGSKANDAAIQSLVVGMKDELEKIKEQLNNVL